MMIKESIKKLSQGFTMVETLVALGILVAVLFVISSFQRDIFFYNNITQSNLNAQMEGRRAIRTMTAELREAQPSSLGSYPIAQAGTSSITFFSNIDNDSLREQIRYFLQGDRLYKATIKPSGNPLTYNINNESVSMVISDVKNATNTPIFSYFDTFYAGTSTPLALPINIPSVRLVKINVIIDRDPNRSPTPLVITSQVTVRNLKDNL